MNSESNIFNRAYEILKKELKTSDGISFLDILGTINESNAKEIEDRLLAIVKKKKALFNELLICLGLSEDEIKGYNDNVKIGFVVQMMFNIYKLSGVDSE